MKRLLLSIVMLAASAVAAFSQQIDSLDMQKHGDWFMLKMNILPEGLNPAANQTLILRPILRNGHHADTLSPIGIYSRNQWYYWERKGRKAAGGNEVLSLRRSRFKEAQSYETMVPYRQWMDGARLSLETSATGCCGYEAVAPKEQYLAAFYAPKEKVITVYKTDTVYQEVNERVRSLSGRAYVDFPLNETVIDAGYHANYVELSYLRASIDSVKRVPGAEIIKIHIKGYASPEGPYDNNKRLAEDRTQAIKGYIASFYAISNDKFAVETEPENWEGLRSFVEASSLPHRAEILKIIDGDRLPDDKEGMIKSRYPADWSVLLQQCLPFLRRTDYRIEYEILNNNK